MNSRFDKADLKVKSAEEERGNLPIEKKGGKKENLSFLSSLRGKKKERGTGRKGGRSWKGGGCFRLPRLETREETSGKSGRGENWRKGGKEAPKKLKRGGGKGPARPSVRWETGEPSFPKERREEGPGRISTH